MGKFVLLSAVLLLTFLAISVESYPQPKDSISTRSTRAEGTLYCGAEPLKGAIVRLFKGSSDGRMLANNIQIS